MIEFDDEAKFGIEVFHPEYFENLAKAEENGFKFAYYTSAETAEKIIKNGELWLRNATVMNDFSEIKYGLNLLESYFSSQDGDAFILTVKNTFSDAWDNINKFYQESNLDWIFETYLASVSLHRPTENENGRLSMWRAYGNTALVINGAPMMAHTDLLQVYSAPVNYFNQNEVTKKLNRVRNSILEKKQEIQRLGQKLFENNLSNLLFLTAVTTKHPGFSEELEWRIFARNISPTNKALEKRTIVLNGVAQEIWALKLRHAPELGLFHADIPSLLERIIIGPTNHPYVTVRAFVNLLESKGVENADGRVARSGIPLRADN